MAAITVSDNGKTWSRNDKVVTPEGKDTSATIVRTLKDVNTLLWQEKNREGGDLTGDSPVYAFTRCKCDEHDADHDHDHADHEHDHADHEHDHADHEHDHDDDD